MKKNLLKRTLAVLLACAMVIGGIQIPAVTANAATFSSTRSQSGYLKVQGVTAVADSISTQEGNALTDGVLTGVTDGNVDTYWHSSYASGEVQVEGTPDAITGNNTITLTLPENQVIVGITYLPRQNYMSGNNGLIKTCQIYVSEDGENFGENPAATSDWTYTSTGSQMGEDITVEKELIFDTPAENVKAVKLVVTSTSCNTVSPYINAAEIGVLTTEEVSPALSLTAPAEGMAVPKAEAILNYVKSIEDKADNAATLTLSDDFAIQDIEGYNNVFKGSVTAARDVGNNNKLNKSSTDTVAITFKFKCDEYPGADKRVVASKANEWGLEFGSGTKLAVFGNNSSNGWPQDSVTIDSSFWGVWHDIAVCFTEGGFRLLVDDQVSTNDRADAEQILDLNKAGTFKINPNAASGMTFADFKVYTDLGVTNKVESMSALQAALGNATLLFSLEESSVAVDPGYTVESTVWTNEAGEEVSTFANGDTYTAAITLAARTGKVFTQTASTIRVGEEDATVEAEITDGGSKMTITYVYDGLAAAEEPEEIDANLTVEARYMSNHIRWDAVENAASYNVYRVTEEGETAVAEGITATSYVDEDAAITGTQYSYKISAVYADGSTAVTEAVQDVYPAGIEAVQKNAQLHKDFMASNDTEFDGARVYTGTEDEVNSVKDLSEGMMVVSFKSADLSAKATLLDIKNAGTTTNTGLAEDGVAAIFQAATNDVYYGRFALGSGSLRGTMSGTGALTTTDWSTAAVRSKTYQTYNSSEKNAWFVHNGQGAGWDDAKWNGFLTRVSNIDTLTIGASVNSGETAMPFNGDIAYVTITDEVLSNAELAAYTLAVSKYLDEYRETAGIRITSEPDKTEYETGEELDLTGLEVKVVYKDAAGDEVVAEDALSMDDLNVTGYDANVTGTQTITVTYEEQTATFDVIVSGSEAVTLTHIEVTAPTKTIYNVGEELDTEGMTVTAVYSNDDEVDVTDSAQVSALDSASTGKKEITVSYEGETAIIDVAVVKQFNNDLLLKNVKANSEQNPESGTDGPAIWAFDDEDHWWHSRWTGTPAEGEVSDGHPSADRPIWIQTGFDGVQYIKEITYQGRATSQGLINEYSIAVANLENPAAEPSDQDFTVVKSGTLENTTDEQTIVLDDFTAATHVRILVKSVYGGTTANTNYVAAKRIKIFGTDVNAIAVKTEPKTTYIKGEDLNLDDLVVEVSYTDGTKNDMQGATVTGYDKEQEGEQTLTVNYAGYTATYNVTVEAVPELVSIEVTAPSKTEYIVGEALDTEGMVVTARYEGDKQAIVTSSAVVGEFDNTTAGEKQVTVTYSEKETTFTVNVVEVTQFDDTVLVRNATANSQQVDADGNGKDNDGPATWAFDDEVHWWHSRWSGDPLEGEVSNGNLNNNSPIWIQTGFEGVQYIKKITYQARETKQGAINEYTISVANLADPTASPEDEDFTVVKSGSLANTADEQTIILDDFTAATHVRISVTSVYTNGGTPHVSAQRIKFFGNVVNSISVTTEPDKLVYFAGEELNLDGMTVTAAYSNNTDRDVTEGVAAECDLSTAGTQKVIVSYAGKTAEFDVTVKKVPASIEVTTLPNKIEYVVGAQELDTEGMVVTAYYDDDTSEEISLADVQITGFNSEAATAEQQITVTYGDKTATFNISIVEQTVRALQEIRVTKPTKDVYVTGETLDKTGMVVTAVYSNNDTADVTEDAQVTGFDSTTAGQKTITVTYTENGVVKTATFDVTVIGLVQFDDAVLRSNAAANSEQLPAGYVNDGGAAWAFDDSAHWWHSRYQDTPADYEVESGHPSADNPIWIQTGFDGVQYIKKITYLPRYDKTNGQGRIKDYQIAIANLEDPMAAPTDDDFTVVKTGVLLSQAEEQTIMLDEFTAATHVRLIVTSLYDPVPDSEEDDYIAVQRIKIFGTVVNDITLTPPAKTSYSADENELNLEGMKVEAAYNDGSIVDVTGKVGITGFDPNPAATGDQTITVSYAGKSKTFVVNVEAAPVTMTGIEATPSKTEYTLGEDLQLTVKAVYSNGTKETVADGYTVSGYDNTKTGQQEITVIYNEMTATFTVTVKEPAPAVDTSELEAEIAKADAIDLTGYKDGAEKDAFIAALAAAKEAEENAESQEAVDAAKEALAAAAANLVPADSEEPVKSIGFDAETDSIIIKEEKELTVTVDPADAEVEWSSSDEEILTIDENGKIKAMWPGEATVTAKAGDKTADIKVTVYGVEKLYDDVKTADWFYDATNWAYINDVMSGYGDGSFGPGDSLARAQFAVIMYRIAGSPEVEFDGRFPDVKAGDWFANAVIWANDNGVITGYTNSEMFGPADKITREQIAAILYRYAKAEGYNVEASDDLADFPDAEKVNAFAKDAMKWAVASGLIKGDGGKLNPQGNANRAEAATLIMRFCKAYVE